jgi:hypothetical protein
MRQFAACLRRVWKPDKRWFAISADTKTKSSDARCVFYLTGLDFLNFCDLVVQLPELRLANRGWFHYNANIQ